MAYSPKIQIKKLALGTASATVSMVTIILTSHLESQWLFYGLVLTIMVSILYAIPGYIGIWIWRMRDVFFEESQKKK